MEIMSCKHRTKKAQEATGPGPPGPFACWIAQANGLSMLNHTHLCFRSDNLSSIEAVARVICKRQIKVRDAADIPHIGVKVDRYWHCVAAELEAGLIDENGDLLQESDPDLALGAYRDWRARHPGYMVPTYVTR